MKINRTYSIDIEIIKSFEDAVLSNNRSSVIQELMKDYLEKFFPKKTKTESLDLKKKEYELKLREIGRLEKEEQDAKAAFLAEREADLLALAASQRFEKFRRDSLLKAKQLVSLDMGLVLVDGLLPSGVSDDVRDDFLSRVRVLHSKLLSEWEKGDSK